MAKWLSEEALQIAEKRREAKGKGENLLNIFQIKDNNSQMIQNDFSVWN